MAKPPYETGKYPPFRKGTQNPANDENFHRRDTHAREMDADGVDDKAASQDYFFNLKHFGGNRCDDQRAEPTRKK